MPFYDEEHKLMAAKLNENVNKLNNLIAAESVKGENNFLNYHIIYGNVLFKGAYSNIYQCTNPYITRPSEILICRIFQPTAKIDPFMDLYLKILRMINRNCSSIIATMDIFHDDKNLVYLFQEHANRGNCLEYLKSGAVIDTLTIVRWATSLWTAMDYLGTMGIIHCNIRPKHLMITENNNQINAKLSGFRDAQIYWDGRQVIQFSRHSWSNMKFATFQAPETYSKNENETYDPIKADIWSFGATFFYILTKMYPFNLAKCIDYQTIDEDIKKRLEKLQYLDIREWLGQMLEIDLKKRTKFDDIMNNSFVKKCQNKN